MCHETFAWFLDRRVVLGRSLAARPAQAANEGQADLDKATQLKMTANTLTDLSEVIRLAESAMDKGIDKANRPFARSLLASTYIQRGSATAAAIFGGKGPDANWPQYRTLALADLEKGIGTWTRKTHRPWS